MHAGAPIGLNRSILSPRVLFTYVWPYCLFPENPHKSGLVERNADVITHGWYSADDWQCRRLGLFTILEPAEITQQQRAHLRNALRRAKQLRDLIICSKEASFRYPPIAVLASDTRATLSTVVRHGPRAVRGWDFKTAPKQPGDGRVEFTKAMPPRRHSIRALQD